MYAQAFKAQLATREREVETLKAQAAKGGASSAEKAALEREVASAASARTTLERQLAEAQAKVSSSAPACETGDVCAGPHLASLRELWTFTSDGGPSLYRRRRTSAASAASSPRSMTWRRSALCCASSSPSPASLRGACASVSPSEWLWNRFTSYHLRVQHAATRQLRFGTDAFEHLHARGDDRAVNRAMSDGLRVAMHVRREAIAQTKTLLRW